MRVSPVAVGIGSEAFELRHSSTSSLATMPSYS